MILQRLPFRAASAAENMAADFLLLKRHPDKAAARFRHYGWRGDCLTFGYAQKIAWVRDQLPPDAARPDLCRRPTGGGLVDHRADWTYALVIPRGHELCEAPAPESYRAVHEAVAATLNTLGHRVVLKPRPDLPSETSAKSAAPSVCFKRPEIFDVVHPASGEKVAGAAQKRAKEGLLFQGSIWKPSVPGTDWDAFAGLFANALASTLAAGLRDVPWPDNDDELAALSEHYASPEWNEAR
ncbi:MAG: lipoate--protein ligase family protein [Opitutaceae bacterium]|jgi:lipoate-protein ligase A|nr:lipoate--protein ligase family protein [Opitutaceae bacterium]